MKAKRFFTIFMLVIMLASMLSAAGCGMFKNSHIFGGDGAQDGGGPESSDESDPSQPGSSGHFFEAEYLEDMPYTFKNVGRLILRGETIYYQASNSDYTESGLYSYNLNTKKEMTYITQSDSGTLDPTDEKKSVNYFAVDEAGNVIYDAHTYQTDPAINEVDFSDTTEADIVNWMISNWGYDSAGAQSNLEGYYYETYKKADGTPDYAAIMKNMRSGEYPTIEREYLVKLDPSGRELFNIELEELRPKEYTDDSPEREEPYYYKGGSYVMGVDCDKDGNMYVLYNKYDDTSDGYNIVVYDSDGNKKGDFSTPTYMDGFYRLPDGGLSVRVDNKEEQKSCIYRVDNGGSVNLDENAGGKPFFSANRYFNTGVFVSDDEMFSNEGTGIEIVKNGASGKSELYLKWMDCDISANAVRDFAIMPDGSIFVYSVHYKNNGGATDEAIILREIDESQVKKKTELKLATIYLDSQFEDLIIDFNRKSNEYHVDAISFEMPEGDDVDYDAACNRYMISLLTDDSIDMLALNNYQAYNHVINFAQKDLLIDLTTVMAKDPEISTDDFLANVIAPFYYNGKLIAMPSDFAVWSLLAKKSDVGDKSGWTAAEVEELLSKKPDNAKITLYNTRDQMLEYVMCTNYSTLVNTETGECNFNSDEFKDALKFANHFPNEIDWDNMWNGDVTDTEMYRNGTLLCNEYILQDLQDLQLQRAVFGDDVTLIGYPTTHGNGGLIGYNTIYGITSHCEDPSAAWQLMRTMFLPRRDDMYYSNISVRKDDFEDYLSKAQDTNTNDVGQEYSWNDVSVTIKPVPDSDVQMARDLFTGTTAVKGCVPEGVMSIVKEEASAYFSGQKSIDEIAANVQSRVKIYLSETR